MQYDFILLKYTVPITTLISLTCQRGSNIAIISFYTNSQYQYVDDYFFMNFGMEQFRFSAYLTLFSYIRFI